MMEALACHPLGMFAMRLELGENGGSNCGSRYRQGSHAALETRACARCKYPRNLTKSQE